MGWKTFAKAAYSRLGGLNHDASGFGGDTHYAESEIKGKEDVPGDATCGKLTVVTKGFNQTGATVCTMGTTC